MPHFVLTPDEDGFHLDKLIAHHGSVSRRIARLAIVSGLVQVHGKPCRIIMKPVAQGTRVDFTLPTQTASTQQPRPSLEIVHLDKYVVVVNKYAGLLSEHDRFGSPCVETILPNILRERGERHDKLWLVHRLDAGTSGVLVLARTPMAVQALSAAFREHRVQKTYWAWASGHLKQERLVQAPIDRVQGTKHGVVQSGKYAETLFVPLREVGQATLIEARPKTGRTHQIRVHAAHIGHALLGDRLYGGPMYTNDTPPLALQRAMLHAKSLVFPHPKTQNMITCEAALPSDFLALEKR